MKQFLRPVYSVPAIIIVAILFIWFMGRSVVSEDVMITVPVERGSFVARVISTGQLQAENATSIEVPSALSGRRLGIYEIQVTEIVEEGTVVDSGDFVASLDHSAVEELMTEAQDELDKAMEGYEDAKIDTVINMSNLRDGLLDARVNVEEKELVLEQSAYESPAVQRQSQLELERAKRNLEQDFRNYDLKQKQAGYDVGRAWEEVRKARERIDEIEALFDALEVKAPKPGMVIYSYDRFGSKIQAGSTVSRWAPTIAELPDLSTMISRTFINEIDVSKVKAGQKVSVGIDAFPEKSFAGTVVSVANIGQVLPEGDAKVFEVIVKLEETDPQLRPAMTTSNIIITDSVEDATFIPLEGVFQNDTAKFVFLRSKNRWVRQIVDFGAENANFIVVQKGLDPDAEISLTAPGNADDLPFFGHDIYEELKKEAEEAQRKKNEENTKQSAPDQNDSVGNKSGKSRGTRGGRQK